MAISPLPLLLLLLAVLAAPTTTSARPCKTIFYLSTTTTTNYPFNPNTGNPNSPDSFLRIRNPRYVTLIFTTTTLFRDLRPSFGFNPTVNGESLGYNPNPSVTSSVLPLKLYSSVSSSFSERSKDIMSVVGALLFGVGCGALTAATMFFIWALCSPRSHDFDNDSSDDEDTGKAAAAKKKLGYVSIPSNPKVVDDYMKKPAPVAKEVV